MRPQRDLNPTNIQDTAAKSKSVPNILPDEPPVTTRNDVGRAEFGQNSGGPESTEGEAYHAHLDVCARCRGKPAVAPKHDLPRAT